MKPATKNIFQDLKQVDRNTMTFTLSPTHVSYANTLRRAIMTEVETVAFRSDMKEGTTTDVDVKYNNTPMTNEMLADRIGLLPIWVADPLKWEADNLSEKFLFSLKVKNEGDGPLDVTASDFKILVPSKDPEKEAEDYPGGNKEFFHPDPISGDTCLIASLKGKLLNQNPQAIELLARATVGKGRDHVRFNPVSQCSYRYTINTDEEEQKKYFERWLRSTKNEDPKALEKKEEDRAKFWREFQTMEVERCFLKDEATGEPYSYDFTIESKGILPVRYIVGRALQVMKEKCLSYASIEKGDHENVKVQIADARMSGFDLILQNEDHTLGNLIQTWMDQNLMDSEEITFAGYKIPHPLRKEMVFRIGVKDGNQTTALALFSKAAKACAAMFTVWKENWDELTSGAVPSAPAPPPGRTRIRNLKLAASAAVANPAAVTVQKQEVDATPAIAEAAPKAKRGKTDPRRGTGAFWTTTPVVE